MKIKDLFTWAFITGDWQIAYREKSNTTNFYNDSFLVIPNTKEYWFADPILFEDDDVTYLFVEAFNRKTYKGDIGYFTISEGKVSNFKLLIDNNFHMSYPLVFKEGNEYFMIPESEENGTVDLYRAIEFPHKWIVEKTLLSGVHYADTTLLNINGEKYLFTYHDKKTCWELLIYKFDIKNREITYIQSIDYDKNICRPAGKFFYNKDGILLRPVQDSTTGYGDGTMLYEISFENGKFSEKLFKKYDNNKIKINGKHGVNKFHTYTKTSKYEVIDFMIYHFDILKKIKWQIRKYKRFKRQK